MTTAELVALLNHAYDGDPWHGPSVVAALAGIDAGVAQSRPLAGRHSIRELVLHLTAWTREVERRLDGLAPGEPRDGDWPDVGGTSDADWKAAQRALADAHRSLTANVAGQSDDRWPIPVGDTRSAPLGTGVTFGEMIVGLATHHAYHAGQITLMKTK